MAASDFFGIQDNVKLLNPPAGFEAVHQDGMSWAKPGLSFEETSKLTARDWNRIIGNLRGLLAGSMLDVNTLDPASPYLLRDVIEAYIDGNALSGAAALLHAFDAATADADPGAGKFRLNHANPASATAAYVDAVDALGVGVGPILDTWDDSTSAVRGVLTLQSRTDRTIRHVYHVTGAVTDGGGYRKLSLAYVGGAGALTAGVPVWLVFVRSGDLPAGVAMLNAANSWTAKQSFTASAAGGAGVNLAPGVAPGAPADGDMWPTAAGWFVRYAGETRQLATLDGAETLINKTLTQPTLSLKQSANPTPTAEGELWWDTDDDVIVLGDSTAQRVFPPNPASLAAGDITYSLDGKKLARLPIGSNGQFLSIVAGVPAWVAGPVQMTLSATQATTSGTAFDFTGIPSWAKMIIVSLDQVSLSGSDKCRIQIGPAAGIETTGYQAGSARATVSSDTSGFNNNPTAGGDVANGTFILVKVSSDVWVCTSAHYFSSGNTSYGAGRKSLAGPLTQLRLTRDGLNTFDGGQVSIQVWG